MDASACAPSSRWCCDASPLLAGKPVQEAGGLLDVSAQPIDRGRDNWNELARFVELFLLDAFADAGDGLHAVSGVEARGVDEVLEPVATRQSGFIAEGSFRRIQRAIQFREASGRDLLRAAQSRLVFFGGGAQAIDRL